MMSEATTLRLLWEEGLASGAGGFHDMDALKGEARKRLRNTKIKVRQGFADFKAGRIKPAEDVLHRLEKKYRDML